MNTYLELVWRSIFPCVRNNITIQAHIHWADIMEFNSNDFNDIGLFNLINVFLLDLNISGNLIAKRKSLFGTRLA
jgi:hypothetical protein